MDPARQVHIKDMNIMMMKSIVFSVDLLLMAPVRVARTKSINTAVALINVYFVVLPLWDPAPLAHMGSIKGNIGT